MITTFGKGTILKGSDCEIVIPISTCCQHIDIDTVQDFSVAFYTEAGGQAIMKYKDDFEFEGDMGLVHFQWQELDQLADGVIRYTIHYDSTTAERTTSYMLKTPMAYTPMDFVSSDEVEDIVSAATSGLATEEYVDEAISGITGGGNVRSDTINVIWTGTQAQYDALSAHSSDTLYFIDQ